MLITDFTKSPEQIIVDLINYDNDTNLLPHLLTFSKPLPRTGSSNTHLIATAIPSAHYTGSVTLDYNRINFADVPGARSINISIGTATQISDLIPQINRKYRLNLTPEDYINFQLPRFNSDDDEESQPFSLVAAPDSLIFINSVVLNIIKDGIYLSSVITKRILNGIMYTQPQLILA